MSLFNHKISLKDIIREIPDMELSRLSRESNVDYCTKVLTGKLVFYLLFYGMLRMDRLSQRGLADAFSSAMFKLIFDASGKKTISPTVPFQSVCQLSIWGFSKELMIVFISV